MNTTLFRKLRFLALALCTLLLAFNSTLSRAADPSVSGLWEPGPTFADYPVHVHLLPNGKLMWWPGNSISGDDPKLFDPLTLQLTDLANAGYDIFCSAHTFLPDGRLLITGGHVDANVGLPDATIYDYTTDTFTKQPSMNLARWYPSSVLMPNGDVTVVAGSIDVTSGSNPLPQVYELASGTWRDLSTAQLSLPVYPKLFLAPNGKVFNAGPTVTTRYLDTLGTGAWTVVGDRTFPLIRDYGAAVTYAPGKIMALGGHGEFPGTLPTNTTEIIDLNDPNPQWVATQPMNFPRRHLNVNVLPDGKILVTGGIKGTGDNMAPENATRVAEMWDPATGQWRMLESDPIRRGYHSSTMLLPDGRIFTAGGNFTYETGFYSPPYLFQGERPVITSAPETVVKNQSFFVGTPDAETIDTATWIRLPSVTHSTDFNQGFIQSTAITQADGGINLVAPDNITIPSGHYMLFLLRGGVPSVAKIIRLDAGAAPNNPAPVVTSLLPNNSNAGNPGFTLVVNGNNFVAGSTVRWNGADRPTTVVNSSQLTAAIPASDIGAAGTAQVTVSNPAPGGGISAAADFIIDAGANLTSQGSIIARVTSPTGGGSRSLQTIRDGVKPMVGNSNSSLQYDTYDGNNTSPDDWIGYQFSSARTFNKVVFQEGKHFNEGGWFSSLTLQVLQGGSWVPVQNLAVEPAYPNANNGTSFETYTMRFAPISGSAIRLFGNPGGSADFISVAELEVYGTTEVQGGSAPVLTTLSPASKTAGDPAFTLTATGSGFVSGATVKWNGANRTTTFVSATQLTAAIPASDVAAAGSAQVTVTNPGTSGGTSATQAFTINAGTGSPNLASAASSIIARVTAPTGAGSKNLQTIRDGVKPAVGSTNSSLQYDTYDGNNTSPEDWIGYQFGTAQTFERVVFQEGRNFADGGFFASLTVQVLQNGSWTAVQNLVATPAYPNANNGTSFETYNLQFTPISGTAIRIFGDPGGSADFISVAELEVYGSASSPQDNPAPVLASITPSSKTAGDPGFTLTVNGSNFVSGAVVKWNGSDRTTAFVSATQLTASIPAGDVAAAGTAQVTVTNPAPGGGTSTAQSLTINSNSGPKNLTALGTVIARVTAPTGGGSKNLQTIRDGVKPAVGSINSLAQYDTYDGNNTSPDDWIGYQYGAPQTFSKVVFQEGRHYRDGGWFSSLAVQVLQNGSWVNVQNLAVTPAYPNANNGTTFEIYELQFTAIGGTAIRIIGDPGGSADFISVGELEIFGE